MTANGASGNGDFLPEEEEDKDYKYLIYRPEQVKQKVRFCILNVFQIDSYEVEVEPHTRFREDLHLDDKKLQKLMRSLERAFKFLWLDPVYLQFSTVQDVIDHIKDMVERNWEIFKEVRSIAAYDFMVDSKYFRSETNFYTSVSARAEDIESFLRALERKFSVVILYTVHAEISTIQEIVDYLQRESAKK